MSDSDRPSSLRGSKRAASPTTAAAEITAQRTEAAAADPPAASLSPLSAAQRCAADTLALVFGFVELKELARAAQTCKAWLRAAAKEKPRGLSRSFDQAERLADLCSSSSPLTRHISRVVCSHGFSLSLSRLTQLRQLPELTTLRAELSAAELNLVTKQGRAGALAFPPKLRQLNLLVSKAHSSDVCQLLLDALPALKGLQKLALALPVNVQLSQTAALSLEPLLHLPRLTHLTWNIGSPTSPQLYTIKQIATLQFFDPGWSCWSAAQLSAFCRPPHRLKQLEQVNLRSTIVDDAALAELACLPALTSLELNVFTADAFAYLPRFPRLQRLQVHFGHNDAAEQAEHNALLVLAMSACPTLTDLTLSNCECPESFGSQLMQAVPRLRVLCFQTCSLPSLRFLRQVTALKQLSLHYCMGLRSGHVFGLGSFAPQLESLTVEFCDGLQLDEAEVQLLTPPTATLGLPHLREFEYNTFV